MTNIMQRQYCEAFVGKIWPELSSVELLMTSYNMLGESKYFVFEFSTPEKSVF